MTYCLLLLLLLLLCTNLRTTISFLHMVKHDRSVGEYNADKKKVQLIVRTKNVLWDRGLLLDRVLRAC